MKDNTVVRVAALESRANKSAAWRRGQVRNAYRSASMIGDDDRVLDGEDGELRELASKAAIMAAGAPDSSKDLCKLNDASQACNDEPLSLIRSPIHKELSNKRHKHTSSSLSGASIGERLTSKLIVGNSRKPELVLILRWFARALKGPCDVHWFLQHLPPASRLVSVLQVKSILLLRVWMRLAHPTAFLCLGPHPTPRKPLSCGTV